jgi:hypothetical protein
VTVTATQVSTTPPVRGPTCAKYPIAVAYAKARPHNLIEMRKQSPREISEIPEIYRYESVNLGLIQVLFGQVSEGDRDEFIDGILYLIEHGGYTQLHAEHHFPKFDGLVSELPLIAEFVIRNGYTQNFFSRLGKAVKPTTGLAVLMLQLEDMVSLNFTRLSAKDYSMFPAWLGPVREMADRQTHASRGPRAGAMVKNPHYKPGSERVAAQIVKSVDNLFGQSKQAKYLYLKGALQQSTNLEIESDKSKVEGYLDSLGFDPLLTATLKRAEDLYNATSDAFDLKSCLGHLRSFLESLHIQACAAIAGPKDSLPAKWGSATVFLRDHGVISQKDEAFITTLYTLVSDEAIHPLIAEREYARLFRNIVIEYGLLFLATLQKKGVTLLPGKVTLHTS